ncbi:hypothetical protein PHYSODRAFT_326789 [Phytophthora sojae]|uniref:HNH nuclease domain-containing protein n=1 Tax=Phytophthora sojae (strain P6497) TaxID=1094619 RepID=G4YZQ3_PHYSP|nr:hypothetical protein PHYSODRAFT_326789 [Phytophthora sojae]EGZ25821.1 hypothetical protein PHYSODRAFT_326789 [Phytophthora sojae]|eukprot:XP_009521109.1 hypothetical protein PHYSODRAFT_326789 [Phytophthora sojae]
MPGTTNIPRNGQIHVLVKRAYENLRVPPSTELKLNLARTYHCDVRGEKLRCMLLDMEFPSELVVAFHLFPVNRNEAHLVQKMMGFDDVNDVRNGLLLFKPLAQAFRGGASFIYDEASDTFRFKMFSKPMLEER